jgi:hypothetical protein
MIPQFTADGLLPEGAHPATLEEMIERFGGNERRRQLLTGLGEALRLLRAAGCCRVYINGSFVTAKERPNDIDVCWDVDGVDPDALDPVFLISITGGSRRRRASVQSPSRRKSRRE